jgi:TM2 domain-containing membrane protein YozV
MSMYPPSVGPYGSAAPDPAAPFGRDPYTGRPLSDKQKVVAGLLQIFLGTLGVGRFYTGHTTIAVSQLLLTVVGWITAFLLIGFVLLIGVAIWAFVDGIMLLATESTDSRGLKLR